MHFSEHIPVIKGHKIVLNLWDILRVCYFAGRRINVTKLRIKNTYVSSFRMRVHEFSTIWVMVVSCCEEANNLYFLYLEMPMVMIGVKDTQYAVILHTVNYIIKNVSPVWLMDRVGQHRNLMSPLQQLMRSVSQIFLQVPTFLSAPVLNIIHYECFLCAFYFLLPRLYFPSLSQSCVSCNSSEKFLLLLADKP